MISSLDSESLRFLSGLSQIQQRSERAQRELTSGLRINTISDAPDQIGSLWQTRWELDNATQLNANLGRVKTEVDSAESALESAVTAVERAQTLASQGATGTASAQNRIDLAGEIGAVLQHLVGIANTSVDGRYIFSGDSDQQAPYTIDLTQTNPIGAYQGSAATRQVRNGDGALITIGKTAQEIFDSPNPQQNVFVVIANLRTALLNNDQAGITGAVADLQTSGAYLNTQLASYGGVQNQVTAGLDFTKTRETQLQTALSGIQDADLAQSITELNQAQLQQQAALQSRGRIPRTTLFDYLA
ncbi:MAG TPA: flagellin [Bryobacteraceae bacterium]